MLRNEVDRTKLSPVMLQWMNIKDENPDAIIFFRLGDFYEMFFDDAIVASKILELTLTGKQAGLDEKVPMCGIPFKAYEAYLDKLVEMGYKVAIVEQVEDPKLTKEMVKREVIQIVTSGTRLDSSIDDTKNNFLASITYTANSYVLSYADISTGEVYVTILDDSLQELLQEIIRHGFEEIIVSDEIDRNFINTLRKTYQLNVTIYNEYNDDEQYSYIYNDLNDLRKERGIKHLLAYTVNTKKGDLSHLQAAKVELINAHLLLDEHTKRNLELTETLRLREKTYSLLWLLDKNQTAMGSRLLRKNLEFPLIDKKELERRYHYIEVLQTEFILRDDLKKSLNQVYDIERLIGRVCYGNLNARDLLQLNSSLKALPTVKKILEEIKYDKEIETFDDLVSLFDNSLNEEPPISLKEGNLIKKGYNEELDELRDLSSGSKDFLLELEQKEKERTGIKNLKVGYNKVFGYYIEISKGQCDLVKDEFGYDRRQTLSNCERFTTKELKEKESIILGAEEKIINLEYQLFMQIREVVKRYILPLQKCANILAEIDMLSALSFVADNYHFVKPVLNDKNEVKIIESRHPVVEEVMAKKNEKYVANDIIMDKDTSILLITGPNMAGKSTYMRQLAITVIMAQIGSFVPAKSCTIPVFDKIFTRIGASDDLVSGESTFMVEMKEANLAISRATKNSLILFDELGRGTATYDGMSLAQAILEYIHDNIGAKTLFSTHYHELTELASSLAHLKNVHVSAVEEDGKLTFLHKIKNGSVDKSYGINVASLADLPKSLIKRAEEILNLYENQEKRETIYTQTSLFDQEVEEVEEKENKYLEKIKEINPLEMSPMDALNFLYRLKEEMKKDE
ncbi:MAG: DNA mismatch repair protein MutS [bacterium]|nr:DNA mismatch repair protein MutS [bacterium]